MASHRAAKLGIVLVYLAAFWGALPYLLLTLGARLDGMLSWSRHPAPLGWAVVAGGLAFVAWGMAALWWRGRSLPVGALPPAALVTDGPYLLVRHPIYLGFNVALVGVGLALGSRALTLLVAPAFLPCWLLYAGWEERRLLRRFGDAYRAYRRRVGMLPRPWYRLAWLVVRLALPVRSEGKPRLRGAAVLVANHSCYLDPFFLMAAFGRPVHFTITAEAYRSRLLGRLLDLAGMAVVRRYRTDPVAIRRVRAWLDAGELVGVFPEGERSPLGVYQGSPAGPAAIVARLGVPVVPVAVVGAYDAGPRWAGVLRRRPVVLRFGPPLAFGDRPPEVVLDEGIRALLDPVVRVHLRGLERARLARILWACPRCGSEDRWDAAALACGDCGARWTNTADGCFEDGTGTRSTLEELGRGLVAGAGWEGVLAGPARGFEETATSGPVRPLAPLPPAVLVVTPGGLAFGAVRIPLAQVRSVTTERADTLQVATRERMWQFRPEDLSVFRLKAALDRWRAEAARSGVGRAGGEVPQPAEPAEAAAALD